MYTPVNSNETIYKRGARGYKSHIYVILMIYATWRSLGCRKQQRSYLS